MISLMQFAVLVLGVSVNVGLAVLPPHYRSLSAREKQAIQWEQILATRNDYDDLPTTVPTPGSNLTLFDVPEYLTVTFTHYSDEMPDHRRRMVLGPYGVVAKIMFRTFRNSSTPFTGLFHSGGRGILRLSLDGIPRVVATFVPMTATKIYIDGDWSRNFQQVSNIVGQAPDRNYFRDSMKNIIDTSVAPVGDPMADAFAAMIALLPGGPLARPVNDGNIGQVDSASVKSDGSRVFEPVAPWETIFVPNPKLTIDSNSTRDFRQDIIDTVNVGDVIYTVYGLFKPNSTVMQLIGEIVCDSEFVSSMYGDTQLFFRHASPQWGLVNTRDVGVY